MLVEIAHLYRHPARVSAVIARRQASLPRAVTDIAWKAQLRLCARFRRLTARRMPHNKIVVAIARELAAFVWAIAREVTPAPVNTTKPLELPTTLAKEHIYRIARHPQRRIGNAVRPRPGGTLDKRHDASHPPVPRPPTLERRQPRDAHMNCR